MKKKKKKPSIGLAKFFDSHVREKQYAYSMSTITHSYSNPALCGSNDRLAGHTVRAVRVP